MERPRLPGTPVSNHGAFLYPDRRTLAQVFKNASGCRCRAGRGCRSRVSESLYLRDPDGNGVEIYRNRDPARWPRDAQDNLAMVNDRLDLEALLAEAD